MSDGDDETTNILQGKQTWRGTSVRYEGEMWLSFVFIKCGMRC